MLREFWQKHPEAEKVLHDWHTVVEHIENTTTGISSTGKIKVDYAHNTHAIRSPGNSILLAGF
jgi:mRNA-degrading endonuclease HigB of HigAB toxin-antitoxin module